MMWPSFKSFERPEKACIYRVAQIKCREAKGDDAQWVHAWVSYSSTRFEYDTVTKSGNHSTNSISLFTYILAFDGALNQVPVPARQRAAGSVSSWSCEHLNRWTPLDRMDRPWWGLAQCREQHGHEIALVRRESFSSQLLFAGRVRREEPPISTVFLHGKLFVSGEIVCSAHLDTAEDLLVTKRTL